MNALIKRHMLCYLRDRWAVFFSFLSVFIILGLFLLFLGNLQSASVPEALRGTPEADYLIYSWIFSGLVVVSSVTVPLGFLHIFIKDHVEKNIDDFYVAPIKRSAIVFSYMFTAFLVGVLLSILSFSLTVAILYSVSGYFLPFIDSIKVIGIIVFSNALFTALFFFIATYLKTLNAHSNLATLTGTLIGFLCGLYVPIGSFSSTIQSILNLFPPMQITALMRRVYMNDALQQVFPSAPAAESYRQFFGVDLILFTADLSSLVLYIILTTWIIAAVSASIFRVKRVSARSR